MKTKLKEHSGFHYLLTEMELYTLILLELNIFLEIRDKSEKFISHNIFRIQDNDSILYGICCMAFIEYMLAGKTLFKYIKSRV